MELTLEQKRALALANARLRAQAEPEAAPTPAPAPTPTRGELIAKEARDFVRPIGNLAAGALRGAGSIGATLLTPYDLLAGNTKSIGNPERRQAMDEGLRSLGADPESMLYQGGKIAGEIAGTAGVGTPIAAGARAAGAPQMLVRALRTGGMAPGSMAARTAGGAVTGGAAGALVNPEDTLTSAAIGGALPGAGKVLKGAVAAGREMVGATTGAGSEALRGAYAAGRAGGTQAQAFKDNMRGNADMLDVLDDARKNLETIRQNRSAQYRQNMGSVTSDKTVLDLDPVNKAVQDSVDRFTFKGQARNPQVLDALQKVGDEVNAWRQLDPAQFHTPEGLDALKQRIGAIKSAAPLEARDVRAAVDNVYNSVKRQIEAQAPTYAKTMKEYTEASDLIDEITRTLSLGDRATADTAMRKLQSIMRNNVNTNYGARAQLMDELEQQGGRQLRPALSGQALNEWMPRGIQRGVGTLSALGAGSLGGIPAAVGTAAMSSPRLMGEAAFLAGQADPYIEALRRSLYRAAPVLGAQ